MRKVNFIILTLAVLLFGCDKEKIQPESLEGTWELRHVLGVQIENASPDYEKGNGNIIEFSTNGYQRIVDGKVIAEGTYKLVEESAEIDGTKFTNRIIFDDDDWKVFIKQLGNKLLICNGSTASDGSTETYEKI